MDKIVIPVAQVKCQFFYALIHEVTSTHEIREVLSCFREIYKLFPYAYYREDDTDILVLYGYSLTPINETRVINECARLLRRHVSIDTDDILMCVA